MCFFIVVVIIIATVLPGEWFQCGEKEWRKFEERVTWADAERSCRAHGGHLANTQSIFDYTVCHRTVMKTCFQDGQLDSYISSHIGQSNILSFPAFRWTSNNRQSTNPSVGHELRSIGIRLADNFRFLNLLRNPLQYICERNICK